MSATEQPPIDVQEVTPEPEPEPAPVPAVNHDGGLHAVGSYLPVPAEWQIILQQADVLAASDLVPKDYRRKPANIVLATLAGRPFGWDASMAMRSFHIIEGMPTMKPEIMLALIRKAGHSVNGTSSPTEASITGVRRDNGDQMTAKFTVWDAARAGLCAVNDDGKTLARSSTGKLLPWEQYPESMCWARALSKLARMLFSDVILGAGYTPEEFGKFVAEDGTVLDVDEVTTPAWATPGPPAEPVKIDEALAQQLTDRARALPREAQEILKGLLAEREITGSFASQTAAKGRIIAPMVSAIETRAKAGEWGEWTEPDVWDETATERDAREAAEGATDGDDGPDPEPPLAAAADLLEAIEETLEAGAAAGIDAEPVFSAEQVAAMEERDRLERQAMEEASGDPFEPIEPEPAPAPEPEPPAAPEADMPGEDEIPFLAQDEIAGMRKIQCVEQLAARGQPTSGNLEDLRRRLVAYETERATAWIRSQQPAG